MRSLNLFSLRAALLASLGLGAAASCGGKTDVCGSSTPAQIDGFSPAGLEKCSNGSTHRATEVACESLLPRPEPQWFFGDDEALQQYLMLPPEQRLYECVYDEDCSEREHGFCSWGTGIPRCVYGCISDEDCDEGFSCTCWEPVGVCAQAQCRKDADCGAGGICRVAFEGCASHPTHLICNDLSDECVGNEGCGKNELCSAASGDWTCERAYICGRPFLVAGAARLARPDDNAGWLGESFEPDPLLCARQRQLLAGHYTRLGLMEHASVAAFARFVLQLLALGAPADLVAAAQRALGDEVEHARLCFSLAARYGQRPVGPGPLACSGALDSFDFRSITLAAFVEGCIGETVAAIEARAALEEATDPRVRRVFERIADDEWRHALLAWRFLQWALARGALSSDDLLAAFVAHRRVATASAPVSDEPQLRAHGLVDRPRLEQLRIRVLDEVIDPCLRALSAAGAAEAQRAAPSKGSSSEAGAEAT